MDYLKINAKVWDKNVKEKNQWTLPVSREEIAAAVRGDWGVMMTPNRPVPRIWFGDCVKGKHILLIAGGGGQQGPILAAAGAIVTVLDNSASQLAQDEMVAVREGLKITTIKGNMQDLSAFADASFDIAMSLGGCFADNVLPIWREAARILAPGGRLLAGHNNPIEYIFDMDEMLDGKLTVRHKIPYSDIKDLTPDEFERIARGNGVCFGHSLEDLIAGQIAAGFVIAGFYEDSGVGYVIDNYISTFLGTLAIKA